jgi:hypothetical protein
MSGELTAYRKLLVKGRCNNNTLNPTYEGTCTTA